ncbi:alpha/beta hydrolase [Paraperlucidibaca sp.]|uniref:alpha/beta fold hydrolase n=1 Tax=Paraperlucidibaca sp. TaxID=2708021 RepID=UPI0030F41DD0
MHSYSETVQAETQHQSATSAQTARESTDNKSVLFVGDNGLILRGTQRGDPSGTIVLLLHGGGQTHHAWSHTARALATAGFCAITLDARGHGNSDWSPRGDYSANALSADLRLVLQSLPSSPIIVGASMGGLTSMLALGEDTSLTCQGLILVDVAPRLELSGVRRILKFMRQHQQGFDSLEQAGEAIAAYNPRRSPSHNSTGLRKNLRLDEESGRFHWHWDPAFLDHAVDPGSGEGLFDREQLDQAAQNLSLPVLLIRGFHSDVLSEEGAQELLSLIPQSDYVVLEQAGHMVAGDRNSVFTEAVLDFLCRLEQGENRFQRIRASTAAHNGS